MTADWVGWSIPRPTLDEVIDGVLGTPNTSYGYNAEFYYPMKGGIEVIAEAIFREINGSAETLFGREVVRIDPDRGLVLLHTGESISYSKVVSTMPLPKLLDITDGLSPLTKGATKILRSTGVIVFNIGISQPHESDLHWIYYPEDKYPFFRAGIYSNFSKDLVPSGCGSIYAEVSYLPERKPEKEALLKEVAEGLVGAGLVKREGDIVQVNVIEIEPAYVIFDPYRREKLPVIKDELEKKGIYSIGRYGSWDYLTMEDAILQGKELAERLK